MTLVEAGKLPEHLQRQEDRLTAALVELRKAYNVAIHAEEQLKATLEHAKETLEKYNY